MRLIAYIDDMYDGLLAAVTVSEMLTMQPPPPSAESDARQQWASVLMSAASQLTRDRAIFIARNRVACLSTANCARRRIPAAQQAVLRMQTLQRTFFVHSPLAGFPPLLRRAAGLAVRHGLVGQFLERDMGGSRSYRGCNFFAMGQLATNLLAQAHDPSSATHLLLHQCQMSARSRGRRYSDSDLPRPGQPGQRPALRGLPPSQFSAFAFLEDDSEAALLFGLEIDPAFIGDGDQSIGNDDLYDGDDDHGDDLWADGSDF